MNRMWTRSGLEFRTDWGVKQSVRDTEFDLARHKERGSVLIAAIFILIILALIAASATTSSVLESHMSVNSVDQDTAFQAAGAALRAGEAAIKNATARPFPQAGCTLTIPLGTCVYGLNTVNTLNNPQTGSVFANAPAATLPWRPKGTSQAAVILGMKNPANPYAPLASPEVVIEYMGFILDPGSGVTAPTGRVFYRITARGTGRNHAQAIIQSTYARRW